MIPIIPKAHSRRAREAFTLLELLAITGILTILAVLIFTGINVFMDRSKGAICAGNMRQVYMALMAYRNDHNGWFSPQSRALRPAKQGVPNSGEAFNFSTELVPNYLGELPVCPSATKKMTPADKKTYGTAKNWFQKTGGTYGINKILTQWKLEALPPSHFTWWPTYKASETPMLLEIYFGAGGSVTNAFLHQNKCLTGFYEETFGVPGRSHGGKNDALNFLFADGHVELISQNDPRDIPAEDKTFAYPTNPNGKFSANPKDGRYLQTSELNSAQYITTYGEY